MPIIIATILFLSITALVWLLNKFLPFEICPICAGVSGTWLLITAGIILGLLGADGWQLAAALAMGGSVVGIAYKSEHMFSWGRENPLLWKLIVIGIGMPLAYLAISNLSLTVFIAEAVLLLFLTYVFFVHGIDRHGRDNKSLPSQVEELEKKMKECC